MERPSEASIQLYQAWNGIREEATAMASREPFLQGFISNAVLDHGNFAAALSSVVANKLASPDLSRAELSEVMGAAYDAQPNLLGVALADMNAFHDRDPACDGPLQVLLFFKGYLAVQACRISNFYWTSGRRELALFIQMRVSEVFGVDIHPAAALGRGLMIDHAHSVVIGETAVVGENVSMLHSVTLGGTGKEYGDRHPKVGDGVLIGAGATILGNIQIGKCSRIAAGSVVLNDIPAGVTVAGVPARIVGKAGCAHPSEEMHQLLGRTERHKS